MPIAPIAASLGTVAAGIVDVRTGLVPDVLSLPTAACVFALAAAQHEAAASCSGAALAAGALLALHVVTRGRGIGLGDVKLALAIGAGLGPLRGIEALGAAFVAGAAYALWRLARRSAEPKSSLPFAPFLAAGTVAIAVASAGAAP
ncbi:MAG TPA: A24 family peptidase [Candidatus Baltobacteraceae bacterium]|nr:A24 family peptidase [Candidatus Baltobacteraceae bacterium]